MSTTPTETTSTPTRRRHILRGDNMVTPRKTITINGERLQPGRHRFALDADLVRAQPELFVPAWSGDRDVRARLRAQTKMRGKRVSNWTHLRGLQARQPWRLDTDTGGRPSWQL